MYIAINLPKLYVKGMLKECVQENVNWYWNWINFMFQMDKLICLYLSTVSSEMLINHCYAVLKRFYMYSSNIFETFTIEVTKDFQKSKAHWCYIDDFLTNHKRINIPTRILILFKTADSSTINTYLMRFVYTSLS